MLDELFAQLVRLDLGNPRIELIEGAVLGDQLRGGLLPHPGHAGDVVRRIALERLVVDHLVRPQAVPLPDPRRVVDDRVLDPRPGRHQARLVGDELEHVQIDRDDRRLDVLCLRLDRQRADHVVGFEALLLVDRDAQGLDDLANLRELRGEVIRHPRSGRLVLGVLLVPERRPGQVERDRDVVRLQVGNAAENDAAEAEDAIDELALRGGERRQRVVAAVHEPEAVEQHQAFHGRPRGMASDSIGQARRGAGRSARIVPAGSANPATREPKAEEREPDGQERQ